MYFSCKDVLEKRKRAQGKSRNRCLKTLDQAIESIRITVESPFVQVWFLCITFFFFLNVLKSFYILCGNEHILTTFDLIRSKTVGTETKYIRCLSTEIAY